MADNSNDCLGDILGSYVEIDEEDLIDANYRTIDKHFDFKVFVGYYCNNNNVSKNYVVAHMRHTPLLYKGLIIPVDNGSTQQIIENARNVIGNGEYQLSFIRNTDGSELLFEFTYGSLFGVPLIYKLKLVNELYDSLSWFEGHTFDKIKKEYKELKSNYDKLEEENKKIKDDYYDIDAKHDELKDKYEELKSKYDELKDDNDELVDNYAELESAVVIARDKFNELV